MLQHTEYQWEMRAHIVAEHLHRTLRCRGKHGLSLVTTTRILL